MGIPPEQFVSLGAVVFSAFACLNLLIRPPASNREWSLIAAFFLTAAIEILDLQLIRNPASLLVVKPAVFICEALLPLAWCVYASRLSGRNLFARGFVNGLFWTGGLILLTLSIIANPADMIFNPDFGAEVLLFLGQAGFYFYLLLTAYLLTALVMLERFFTALSRRDRWIVKFESLGIGAILAMQILYFSQGLLYRTLDMSLITARTTAVAFGVLLFLYSRLRRGRPARLTLSRAAAFRSIVLITVSCYLLFLGLVGEGLRYLGPSSGRAFFYGISLIAGVALCTLLLSDTLRRKTMVFLHKHFHRQKYDYRVLWMQMTDRLGAARDAETLSTAILEMYCQTFAISGGALYLYRDKEAGMTIESIYAGFDAPGQFDPEQSLAEFLTSKQWVFNISENSSELRPVDLAQLKGHEVHFVVPLFFEQRLGGVVVLGRQINPEEPAIYEDYDLMKIFGRQAAAALYNQLLSKQLSEQREMAAVGKVSAFVMHDLKNLVSNLSLVVENARELIHNPCFQKDMLETLWKTVQRMNGLIGRLKNVGETNLMQLELCNLKHLVVETVHGIGTNTVEVYGDDVDALIDRSEIGKVITNLVLNGLEASNGNRTVEVEIGRDVGPMIICRDQGCGMSGEFIVSNLFRPFETTKKKGLGIGLYQCRQIVEAHGGRMEVVSTIGKGSEFKVYLPPTKKQLRID